VPVVIRLSGTNEKEGRELLKDSTQLISAETMAEAAQKIIAAANAK
jgi:succinyl-CoA synthetase beta subunit